MKESLKLFICENLYPFCDLKNGVRSELDKDGNKVDLTANDKIKNHAIREENLKRVNHPL